MTPAAQGDRQADGRVAADLGPADQVVEVDVTNDRPAARRGRRPTSLAREGVKLSFLPFFAKAAIDALKEHPSLNAVDRHRGGRGHLLRPREPRVRRRHREGPAHPGDQGRRRPVDRRAWPARSPTSPSAPAPTRSAPTSCPAAPSRSPTPAAAGALFDTPIINQPQVAILGTGTVVKRPVVIDDPNLGETIAVRQMVYLALTYDHRIVDGADAARFLTDVKQRLEAGSSRSDPPRWSVTSAGPADLRGRHGLSVGGPVGSGHEARPRRRRPASSAPPGATTSPGRATRWSGWSAARRSRRASRTGTRTPAGSTARRRGRRRGRQPGRRPARALAVDRSPTSAPSPTAGSRPPAPWPRRSPPPTASRRFVAQNGIAGYGDRGDRAARPRTSADRRRHVHGRGHPGLAGAPPRRRPTAGARVAVMRTGVILDRRGGALKPLLPRVQGRARRPGRLGRAVLLDDLADRLGARRHPPRHARRGPRAPTTCPAPNATTNAEFGRQLGRMLHRPAARAGRPAVLDPRRGGHGLLASC